MTDHFSYLLDDPAQEFFTKAACDAARRIYGIPATATPDLQKEAAAPVVKTAFEKVAARLDRDIFILKTSGPCGKTFGMCKRANAYLDVLVSNCNLTAEQFGDVFDKVAAAAIETDLQATWDELSDLCPDNDARQWLETELCKIGYDLSAAAELEKTSGVFSGLGKVLTHGRALASATRHVPGSLLRRGAELAGEGSRGFKGSMGWLKAERGAKKALRAEKALKSIETGGAGVLAKFRKNYGKSLQAQIGEGRAAQVKGLERLKKARGSLSAEQEKALRSARARKPTRMQTTVETPKAPEAPKAPKAPAENVRAKTKTETIKGETERERAASAAGKAAKGGDVIPINQKGTGTTGAAPKINPDNVKPVSPAAAEQAGAPKGLVDKIRTEGWNSLTGAEKMQVAAAAYVGGKVVFGEGL